MITELQRIADSNGQWKGYIITQKINIYIYIIYIHACITYTIMYYLYNSLWDSPWKYSHIIYTHTHTQAIDFNF